MLDVKKNRLDYGRLLMPPEGFVLRQAVAATYSVDLDTLLSIPVALYYAQTLEGNLQGKDVQLIRAIRHTAGLLTIYHQAGQLKVPRLAKDIHAYFEDSLLPILPSGAFTSFHPKSWVLRYENQDIPNAVIYQLLVLSRNLTFDRSWDVAACLEGKPDSESLDWNQPLVDFHRWLNKQRPFPNSEAFLEELSRVQFEVPEEFDDYAFHPIGIPGYKKNPVATQSAQELLCLSPFLHPTALDTLWENVAEVPSIFSRQVELTRLPPDTVDEFECYCLSDLVVDGERLAAAAEGDGEPLEQDLHAKVFLFDDGTRTTWFLGSANATRAAFERNVEFLLELKGTHPSTRLSKVRKQLLGNDEAGELFIPFSSSQSDQDHEEEHRRRQAFRTLEYDLLKAKTQAAVTLSENNENYDFALTINLHGVSNKDKFKVSVRPFVRMADDQPLQFGSLNKLIYPNISETSLSRFLHYTITDNADTSREFLVRIDVDGIPQSRLDNIFKSIINSRDKFFAYLRFLLSDDLTKDDLDTDPSEQRGHQGNGSGWELDMPIFEQLLVTASRNPARMLETDRVIASLREANGDGVIPDDFLSLWEVFKAAIPPAEDGHE